MTYATPSPPNRQLYVLPFPPAERLMDLTVVRLAVALEDAEAHYPDGDTAATLREAIIRKLLAAPKTTGGAK